jgi:hypothetical protein
MVIVVISAVSNESTLKDTIVDVLTAVDAILLGTVLLVIGYGLYELFIDADDFMETPVQGFHRLVPGGEVRLKYAFCIICREVVKDAEGRIVELRCTYDDATRHIAVAICTDCPVATQCRSHAHREAPTSNPRTMQHWQACHQCEHRPYTAPLVARPVIKRASRTPSSHLLNQGELP